MLRGRDEKNLDDKSCQLLKITKKFFILLVRFGEILAKLDDEYKNLSWSKHCGRSKIYQESRLRLGDKYIITYIAVTRQERPRTLYTRDNLLIHRIS